MYQNLISVLPIAVIWCAITGHLTLDNFALGYLLGVLTLLGLRLLGIRFGRMRSLMQPLALLIYAGTIFWNALKSSISVARMVLSREIKLETGVVALNTGDLSESQLLTALSAHGINTTPGEVVIDIADGGMLYIHCLNLEKSRRVIEDEQARRLRLLRRILGEPNDE